VNLYNPPMSTAVANDLVQKSLVGEAMETATVAVFVADENGNYLAVNAYACSLLGYEREELLLRRLADVAVNEDADDDFDELVRKGSHTGRAVLRHKDGRDLPVHFRSSETTAGGMQLYVGVCWPVD
jgi:PAS domain S-box-containing protein